MSQVAVTPIIYDFGKGTPHHFLSNFFLRTIIVPVHVLGFTSIHTPEEPEEVLECPSVENAYQLAKTLIKAEQERIRTATPGSAKRLGRIATIRKGWEGLKVGIMAELLSIKFKDPELRQMLLDTAPKMLVEGNYWHDQFYGVCFCNEHQGYGENKLGTLLMGLRDDIQQGLS